MTARPRSTHAYLLSRGQDPHSATYTIMHVTLLGQPLRQLETEEPQDSKTSKQDSNQVSIANSLPLGYQPDVKRANMVILSTSKPHAGQHEHAMTVQLVGPGKGT